MVWASNSSAAILKSVNRSRTLVTPKSFFLRQARRCSVSSTPIRRVLPFCRTSHSTRYELSTT